MAQLSEDDAECDPVFDDELLEDSAQTRVSISNPPPRPYRHGPRPELVRPGDLLAGKYRVERVHPASANGVTVEALHTALGRRVAVRLLALDPIRHPVAKARFLRGARLAVRYQNAHTARIVDVGSLESGVPYRVTELLSGADLGRVLRVRNVLPVSEAVDYLRQACEGLSDAHAAGVAHLNLKPSNLFVTHERERRRLVVLDFGSPEAGTGATARAGRTRRAFPGLPYLAPEQVREPHSLDIRADIWALGAILHEMLTGSPLYEVESTQTLMAMMVAEPVWPATTGFRADVPAQLESILARCLTNDRADRYASARELAAVLAPFASAERRPSSRRLVGPTARESSEPNPTLGSDRRSRAIVRVAPAELSKAPAVKPRSGSRSRSRWGELVLTGVALATAGACGVFVAVHVMERALAAAIPARSLVAELSPALPAAGKNPPFAPQTELPTQPSAPAGTSAVAQVLGAAPALVLPRAAPAQAAPAPHRIALSRSARLASSELSPGSAEPAPGLFDQPD